LQESGYKVAPGISQKEPRKTAKTSVGAGAYEMQPGVLLRRTAV